MALKAVLDEPEEPKGPSVEEQLEAERADRQRQEALWAERQAAYEGRLEQIERSSQRVGYQPTMTPQQAQQDLGLSAEDIANDPDKALKMLEDRIRQSTKAELSREYAPVIQGLAQQAFHAEMEGLRSRKYWSQAQKDVERYFADNPHEALQPGRAKEVFNYLVGTNHEQYEKAAAAAAEKDKTFTRERMANEARSNATYDPPMRAPAPRAERDEKDEEVSLSDEEELVRQQYNRLGANISKREWRAISDGKIFPKTQNASDWQRGWGAERKSERKVRGLDY